MYLLCFRDHSDVVSLMSATPDVTTVEVCAVKATLHGPYVTKSDGFPVNGHFCSKSNVYVFVAREGQYYKMTAVSLEQAKASTAPASVGKYIGPEKGNLDTTQLITVCNMWEGDGFKTVSIDGYKLKDVKVTECGSYISM